MSGPGDETLGEDHHADDVSRGDGLSRDQRPATGATRGLLGGSRGIAETSLFVPSLTFLPWQNPLESKPRESSMQVSHLWHRKAATKTGVQRCQGGASIQVPGIGKHSPNSKGRSQGPFSTGQARGA